VNLTHDSLDLIRGQKLLSQLPELLARSLEFASVNSLDHKTVACTFRMPNGRNRVVTATTSMEAIRAMLAELAALLTEYRPDESNRVTTPRSSTIGNPQVNQNAERSRSKTRQLTVGVTMPKSLKQHLTHVAETEGSTFADVSRTFVVYGFNNFEDQSSTVKADDLLSTLKNELRAWCSQESEQVMLRLEAKHAVRIRLAAKEYRKSASELSALCVAHGVALQEELRVLDTKVSKVKGAAVRKMLPSLHLEPQAAPLIAGVLTGSIRAPKLLRERLAAYFETTEYVLADLFRRSFASRTVPAFKSELSKPVLSRRQTDWDDAVLNLNLSKEEENELIELGN